MTKLTFRKHARGVSLIDVMISVAVLATGMLAMAALQASLVRAGAEARTRSQAVALAEGALGALRSRADADISVYQNLTTANWASIVNDTSVTAPAAGTYRENFTVTAQVDRFVLRETQAACGAGNVPCFRPATAADPAASGDPEFKRVRATVTWTDAGGTTHDISLVDILSSLPSANSDLLVDRDLSGSPRNAAGPSVRIPIPNEVGIIPIGIGDGRETAATNPKPVIDTRSGVPTTRFDVLTYRNDSTSAQVQRRVENNVIACTCKFGPPTVTDASATFFTEPVRPTFWNGARYATPTFAVDDRVTHPPSWGAPDVAQSSLCDDCCRDHHDPAGATNKVSPLLTSHEHFGFGADGNVDLGPPDSPRPVTTGLYAEACRMIRVDGIWRVAADFRLEQMGLLKTTTASGRQAATPAPDSSASRNYENFAKTLIVARSNPPTGPSSLSQTDIDGLVSSNNLNDPAKVLITQPVTDLRFLHNRALYYDFLEQPARDFIAAQIANCTESDVALCILPFVPVTSLNATELAPWGRSDETHLVVDGQAGLVKTFDPRRGVVVADEPGGRVKPAPGGVGVHPDGTQSSALVGMSRSNRGLLALSFPGAGVNPTDRAESLSDSQLFEFDSNAAVDRDRDGVPDGIDNCPTVENPDPQVDTDGDGEGDACDIDDDNDGLADGGDSCPVTPNTGVDNDRDGIDDACDPSQDMDRDGVLDGFDNCPMVANPDQRDTNGNGIGDECERDTDNDGVPDHRDNCPAVANPGQEDADNDGQGDACEPPTTVLADFTVNVAITGENLAVLSPKPRVSWLVSSTANTCQASVSPTDSDPNPYVCDNAVAPSPTLLIDQYNRLVTAGPASAQVTNPCRNRAGPPAPNGPAKVFPATCYNYQLRSLTQNGTGVPLTGASVQNPGAVGPAATESTSIQLSNLADRDAFVATFELQSKTSLLGLGEGTGYTCSSATNEPTYNTAACPQ